MATKKKSPAKKVECYKYEDLGLRIYAASQEDADARAEKVRKSREDA